MQSHLKIKPLAILGAGSWGTALALYLSRLGQNVRLWSYQPAHIRSMIEARSNLKYLPNHLFPASLSPVVDLNEAINDVDDILIAVPSVGFFNVLTNLKKIIKPNTRIVWVTKGLHEHHLLHEVVKTVLGDREVAVLSGPSFASEVAKGLPTAVVAGSNSTNFSKDLITRFNSKIFRVYSSRDITGVEIGGIVKNVLAIATGISDGMQMGANARCALITRGLAEMIRLGLKLGGQYETFTGLAGVGDLILTCTDNQSRNRRFGLAIGAGSNPQDAEHDIGQVVEGKRNAKILLEIAKKNNVEMPITEIVYEVIYGIITPQAAAEKMLTREPREE